jgi:hypothetical protein
MKRGNKAAVACFKVKVPYLPGETERKAINNFNGDSPSTVEIEILDLRITTGVPTTKSRYLVAQKSSEEYKRQAPHYNRCYTFYIFLGLVLVFSRLCQGSSMREK